MKVVMGMSHAVKDRVAGDVAYLMNMKTYHYISKKVLGCNLEHMDNV